MDQTILTIIIWMVIVIFFIFGSTLIGSKSKSTSTDYTNPDYLQIVRGKMVMDNLKYGQEQIINLIQIDKLKQTISEKDKLIASQEKLIELFEKNNKIEDKINEKK